MMTSKKAILVTSFGTSQQPARDNCIGSIEKEIASAFPDWVVRRAFTSRMIIKRIFKETGEKIDYIDDALKRLADEGFDTVIVQPTHFIKGIEYEDVVNVCAKHAPMFKHITVSKPLLDDEASFDTMVDIVKNDIVPSIRSKAGNDCGIVLMGHGSEHFSNSCYSQVYIKMRLAGMDDVFIVCLDGFPKYYEFRKMMREFTGNRLAVMPFMIVAGVHALEDMAGDEPGSLKNLLSSEGFEVTPIMEGFGQYGSVRKRFVELCRECMDSLSDAVLPDEAALSGPQLEVVPGDPVVDADHVAPFVDGGDGVPLKRE